MVTPTQRKSLLGDFEFISQCIANLLPTVLVDTGEAIIPLKNVQHSGIEPLQSPFDFTMSLGQKLVIKNRFIVENPITEFPDFVVLLVYGLALPHPFGNPHKSILERGRILSLPKPGIVIPGENDDPKSEHHFAHDPIWGHWITIHLDSLLYSRNTLPLLPLEQSLSIVPIRHSEMIREGRVQGIPQCNFDGVERKKSDSARAIFQR